MSPTEYQHDILWDPSAHHPVIQIKEGILRRQYLLRPQETSTRNRFVYGDPRVTLRGTWSESPDGISTLSLELTNETDESVKITRLIFPAENGLDKYLEDFPRRDLRFLRNGYQSWSTARSYRMRSKPLRPWLHVVSQVTSNMANLPSNTPGVFNSDMYTLITAGAGQDGFLVGQGAPFHQFFYILLNLKGRSVGGSAFELTFDFGRQYLAPGVSLTLDAIHFGRGEPSALLERYFDRVGRDAHARVPKGTFTGYGTWYYYFDRITPEDIRRNLEELKKREVELSTFQIDDGWQVSPGDWLTTSREFADGEMKRLAEEIRAAGYTPGLWMAPFIASAGSRTARIHPDWILKNEYGRRLLAGYNPTWPGTLYFGLDITNPRFEEYLRKVIRTVVKDWGYGFLKLDFLFAGCLRGAIHHDMTLSRAQVLRRGMEIIREEAGNEVLLEGCGMPLSTGIGLVDLMRVGPDTGPFWIKPVTMLLRSGTMLGLRNSLRNSLVRAPQHRRLWLNDPDCLMLRRQRTRLTEAERQSQVNALTLLGGPLLISDDLTKIPEGLWNDYARLRELHEVASGGRITPLDFMDREIPEMVWNSGGLVGVFNWSGRRHEKTVALADIPGGAEALADAWTGKPYPTTDGRVHIGHISPHGSVLCRVIRSGQPTTDR